METPVVEHNLDAIFSLTANPAWLTDYVLGDHSVFGTSRPGAVSGWPTISVPFGYVCGLPVGVSFLGPRWSEPRLLALAYAFEQATNSRRAPELLPDNRRGACSLASAFAYAKANTRQANARGAEFQNAGTQARPAFRRFRVSALPGRYAPGIAGRLASAASIRSCGSSKSVISPDRYRS